MASSIQEEPKDKEEAIPSEFSYMQASTDAKALCSS